MIKKIKDFWYKERTGWIWGFSSWILDSPRALSLLLFIGSLLSFLVFTSLAVIMWIFVDMMAVKVIFTFLALLTLWKFIDVIRAAKRTGSIDNMIEGMSAKDFIGGNKNGNFRHKSNEVCCGGNEETSCDIKEGFREDDNNNEPESLSFSELVQESDGNRP